MDCIEPRLSNGRAFISLILGCSNRSRLMVLSEFSKRSVPINIMIKPYIPGLANDESIKEISFPGILFILTGHEKSVVRLL